jgi:methyl-accepting chemotaxis protein
MAAAVAGGLAISLIPDSAGAWRMLAPLAAMAGYLVFAFTRSQHSTPRVADSAYFLGFLWTLWALINVLAWQPQLKAADLYATFGFALITTAAGMFVRLTLVQFHRTHEDQKEQAVDRVDESVARLVKELELAQDAAASLRASGVLALQEWHKQFVLASQQTVNDVKEMTGELAGEGKELAATFKGVQQSVASTGRLFTSLEKRLGMSTERTASAIERSVEALESSIESLVKRLEELEVPPDLVRGKVDQVVNAVQSAITPVAELAAKTLLELRSAVNDVSEAVLELPKNDQLQAGVKNLVAELNLVTQACENLTRTAGESAKSLAMISTGAGKILAELDGVDQKVGDVRTRVDIVKGALETVGRDADKVDTAIKDVVRFVQSNLTQQR